MNNNVPCLECGVPHETSADARHLAYVAIYRAQSELGDTLPWQEERRVYHKAIHEYYSRISGKIDSGDIEETTN